MGVTLILRVGLVACFATLIPHSSGLLKQHFTSLTHLMLRLRPWPWPPFKNLLPLSKLRARGKTLSVAPVVAVLCLHCTPSRLPATPLLRRRYASRLDGVLIVQATERRATGKGLKGDSLLHSIRVTKIGGQGLVPLTL